MKKKRAWQQLDGKGQYQRGFSEGLCFSGSLKARVRPDSLIMQSLYRIVLFDVDICVVCSAII